MKVTASISGLDTMKLGASLRQALLDALRARVTPMPRREGSPDPTIAREFGMPNELPYPPG
jgi:hypothetical protein